MTGASTIVTLDGHDISGMLSSVRFEVDARSVAKVTLQCICDVEIDGEVILSQEQDDKSET